MRGRTRARARLVAAELEQRWTRACSQCGRSKTSWRGWRQAQNPLTQLERERLLALALMSRASDTVPARRKRTVRRLIGEIVVRVENDAVSLVIH